jgi:hypothetical protein
MEPPEKESFVNREPLTDGVPVKMALTDTQREQLAHLVYRQGKEHKELIFVSAAPFWSSEAGGTRFRMRAKWVRWPIANKILKLINAPERTDERITST